MAGRKKRTIYPVSWDLKIIFSVEAESEEEARAIVGAAPADATSLYVGVPDFPLRVWRANWKECNPGKGDPP